MKCFICGQKPADRSCFLAMLGLGLSFAGIVCFSVVIILTILAIEST